MISGQKVHSQQNRIVLQLFVGTVDDRLPVDILQLLKFRCQKDQQCFCGLTPNLVHLELLTFAKNAKPPIIDNRPGNSPIDRFITMSMLHIPQNYLSKPVNGSVLEPLHLFFVQTDLRAILRAGELAHWPRVAERVVAVTPPVDAGNRGGSIGATSADVR